MAGVANFDNFWPLLPLIMSSGNLIHPAILPPQYKTKQSAAPSQTTWPVTWPVQTVTEDIFIRTVRPRCSMKCF